MDFNDFVRFYNEYVTPVFDTPNYVSEVRSGELPASFKTDMANFIMKAGSAMDSVDPVTGKGAVLSREDDGTLKLKNYINDRIGGYIDMVLLTKYYDEDYDTLHYFLSFSHKRSHVEHNLHIDLDYEENYVNIQYDGSYYGDSSKRYTIGYRYK